MSLVQTEITLKNTNDVLMVRNGLINETEIRQLSATALVDTGAWTLVINEETREKLGLEIVGTAPGTLADGTKEAYKMAGPLEVNWKDRRVTLDAIVAPNAEWILLGAIPLEAMDLVISPRQELVEASEKETMHLLCGYKS